MKSVLIILFCFGTLTGVNGKMDVLRESALDFETREKRHLTAGRISVGSGGVLLALSIVSFLLGNAAYDDYLAAGPHTYLRGTAARGVKL